MLNNWIYTSDSLWFVNLVVPQIVHNGRIQLMFAQWKLKHKCSLYDVETRLTCNSPIMIYGLFVYNNNNNNVLFQTNYM